tara:strand:- start:4169 stop:4339 length:171 start_codon:yes stop_codon:yes gene_type:complete
MEKQQELMVIPAEILQATLNYLASRPYNETAKLIDAVVKNSARVEQPKSEASEQQA